MGPSGSEDIMKQPPVFGVAGWKNSGKTTLVAGLIAEFVRRGFKVAALKHAHHAFDIDHEGRDSYTFRQAGAREVAVISAKRWALMTELGDDAEPALEAMLARLEGSDLVIVEGFKASSHPKIEVRRREARRQDALSPEFPGIAAIAADHPVTDAGGLPVFGLNDIGAIADFIQHRLTLDRKRDVRLAGE